MCNISERYLNDLKFLYERTIDVQLEIMEIDNKLHDFDNEISFHDFDDFFSVQNTSFENFLLMACSSYYGSKLLVTIKLLRFIINQQIHLMINITSFRINIINLAKKNNV